ncbi:hypothetical protein WP8W18C04_33240 [Enterobacter cloacae]|uniref:hypothetical protein n=1 Tax=Enterobacter TaxID=547 RepID=UPI0015DC848B|nr:MULTISPECIES: hypothetical protein [Enterobacter]BBT46166.1 hypothetical protein WP8W18C04_33240 [Enterobacter cloacae]HDW1381310.1 hypothetical protein [Enterobacter asburiae]MBE3483251.1 hypothetical protein [Enterobacter cloacae complex sp. P14RS]MBG0621155.1 hypothetical protein [Enterobacter roggenkampii]MDK9943653.1 hypothetical protein [Enterobacter roggenkampii]
MVWNGVPFPFIESVTQNDIVLQISKLPTIMVDSGFPWESILGSVIAGSIPAYIAWKTIKYNNELIKRQITVAAQQKKCDELRDLFSNFLSLYDTSVEYVEMLFDEYEGDRAKIPFEKIAELKGDAYKLKHCTSLIFLMIGPNDPSFEPLSEMIAKLEHRIAKYFSEYSTDLPTEWISLAEENGQFLNLFHDILEREQAKI